ncbi:snoRNA binding protein [Aspergillus steynii IBT 23096]|uniref:SnoRNA binding protein n=1 Tax=Aspergillus steynii IBT 23096 TaxID=1392250 RepID=A0A2I2FVJ7_9EURO|nr:snoRNA binding protein [Aspergillus steynii IBT 23096]PLB44673.1 snoRNA binding protein [Aspergillus steynii IBT 23096]
MPSTHNGGFDLPLAKRQKRLINEGAQKHPPTTGSRIFAPFRTLGLVSSTPIPFTYVRLGKATFQITTCVGNSLQTYDLKRGLTLVFVSRPETPESITATFAWQDKVFAAWGSARPGSSRGIWVFKRGKKVASLQIPADFVEPIERLLVLGTWIVGCSSKCIQVWKNNSYEHYTTLTPTHATGIAGGDIYTSEMCNMPTYLNKIFVGRYDGSVDVWNVKTGKLVYSMLPESKELGAVSAIQPSPALSLIAVAHKNGALSILNVDTGRLVLPLRKDSSSLQQITSIAFRTDGLGAGADGRKPGVMATSCMSSGDVTLWDLNNGGRVMGILRRAHAISEDETGSGINHVEFLDGQPVLVSSGKDNALRTWIFDESPFSPVPRPLHSRRGHSAAITTLGFLPSVSEDSEFGGKWLLSAGKDRSLWGFSVRKDSQNTEISQGAVERKARKSASSIGVTMEGRTQDTLRAPEITCIACSLNRDGGIGVTTSGSTWANPKMANTAESNKTGWESIVTGHRGDKYARTWFWGKKKAGRWAFETSDGTDVKSVAVSQCGTFALIGSAGGSIDMFNMQSGAHRLRLPGRGMKRKSNFDKKSSLAFENNTKHTKAVTGLWIDGLNQTIISCSLDGKVKFWDFVTGSLVDELDWHPMASVTGLRYSSASELVAFSCDDLSIRVVDIETRKVVREFWGCVGQINDFTFSADGRWIIAASMDSIIRVWDMPTGHLIDLFRVPTTCTSLSMSPTGEFLATSHANGMGINLWSNRSVFVPVSTQNMDENDVADIAIPTASGEHGTDTIEAAFVDAPEQIESAGPVLSNGQLSRDMMTLSVVPRNKWQALIKLDLIKERNKPPNPPKAPEKAPFFLPAVSRNANEEDMDNSLLANSTVAERSRIARLQHSRKVENAGSQLATLLGNGHVSGDFDPFVEHLKSLSPAKADLEIRSLNTRVQNGRSELSDFISALSSRLLLKRDFEVVNAWMAVVLKIHADVIAECSAAESIEKEGNVLKEVLIAWAKIQQQEAQRLAGMVGYCRGVVSFLRSSR